MFITSTDLNINFNFIDLIKIDFFLSSCSVDTGSKCFPCSCSCTMLANHY